VVNKFTKKTLLILIVIVVIASRVANLFMKQVFRHHGIPSKIISDRNSKFVGEFWTIFFKLYSTKIKFNTTL